MSRSKWIRRLALCVLALPLWSSHKATAQQLTSANLVVSTGSDDKDHDTGVYVQVVGASGQPVLAWVQNADNCGSSDCTYQDNSQHVIQLRVTPNISKSACENFNVRLGILANGHDTWAIREAILTLRFSDGTQSTKTVYNLTLNGRSGQMATVQF